MKTPVDIAPEQWLRDVGVDDTKDIREILATYRSDSVLRVYAYKAPHLFLRFHGSNSRNKIYQPNYWADGSAEAAAQGRASQFSGFLTDEEIRTIAKNYYREITAISRNWNPSLKADTLWKIQLRGAESVIGLEGPAKAQPIFQADKQGPASDSTLSGGATQVYLYPKTPFVCTPVDW